MSHRIGWSSSPAAFHPKAPLPTSASPSQPCQEHPPKVPEIPPVFVDQTVCLFPDLLLFLLIFTSSTHPFSHSILYYPPLVSLSTSPYPSPSSLPLAPLTLPPSSPRFPSFLSISFFFRSALPDPPCSCLARLSYKSKTTAKLIFRSQRSNASPSVQHLRDTTTRRHIASH